MVLVPLLLLLLASATAQMDPKALRPCFERYPNYRLVSLKPYHSEWRMRTEESCLQFCSDTRSRCRSIVYDSVQHICHFFLDDGNDFAIPAAKMIYLRVTSRDCLDPGHASGEVSYMDINSREKDMAPPMAMPTPMSMPPMAPMPTVPPGQFIIPATPTESFETTTETPAADTSLEMDMDMFDDFTTPASPFDEAILDNAEEDIELERLQRKNELMRDINGLENQNKRWQSSMEQLVKNTDEFAFKGTRVSPPVRAVKVLPPRIETSTATVHVATVPVKPTEVEPIIERSTTRAPTTTESVLLIKEKLLEKLDVLKQKYPSRYAQYLAEKEKRLGMDSFLSSRLSSNEDILTQIPVDPVETVKTIDNSLSIETAKTIDNSLSIDDAEVVVPMTPIRPKKHRRTKFSGKRIAFSDDHMFSRKIDGADIRRQQQSKLKQVSLSASTSPPFVNKARSFLDMVNNKRDRTHGVKNNVLVENQLDNSATVTITGSDVTGCSKGDTPILMTFENSVGSSSIDSNFVENWEACRQMCQDENCRSFTYYDDKQCMINTEDEGVNLRPPTMGPYTAQTTLKFCYPDNVSPFHGCANFVGFRDYSLTAEPRELFEGLPPGYDGLKLCTELCVLSAEYSCRSASFEMLDGVCKLYAVDSISAPKSFELSNVQYQLYFENGCSAQPELSLVAKDYVAIERVPMKDQSSRKALQMKPSKLKIHKLDRRRKNTGPGNL